MVEFPSSYGPLVRTTRPSVVCGLLEEFTATLFLRFSFVYACCATFYVMCLFTCCDKFSNKVDFVPLRPTCVSTDNAASANSRRSFFEKGATAVVTGLAIAYPSAANAYKVPDLPYAFEALEPYIDAPTMKIHHDKHHATYVANINKATEGQEEKRKLWQYAKFP